jgi:hypothetical protein
LRQKHKQLLSKINQKFKKKHLLREFVFAVFFKTQQKGSDYDVGRGVKVYVECGWMRNHSEAVAPDPLGELQVLAHDGHSLGMDGAKVGVLKERDQVGLGRLLKGKHGLALEPDLLLELSGDLADEALEGELADEQVGLNKQQAARKGPP